MDINKFLSNINIININNNNSNTSLIINSNKIWNDKLLLLLKEYNKSSINESNINNSFNIVNDIYKLTVNLSSLLNAADSFVSILYLLYSNFQSNETNDDLNIIIFNLSIVERNEILNIILNTLDNVINMLLKNDK